MYDTRYICHRDKRRGNRNELYEMNSKRRIIFFQLRTNDADYYSLVIIIYRQRNQTIVIITGKISNAAREVVSAAIFVYCRVFQGLYYHRGPPQSVRKTQNSATNH